MRTAIYFRRGHRASLGSPCARGGIRGKTLVAAVLLLAPGVDAATTAIEDSPLAPRSAPAGATLFTTLPPGQTGIVVENRYADPSMWDQRYQEFAFGAIGTGVTIGDYDGDGRPDVFVVSKTERSRLFRNLGQWRFEDVTERAGLQGPTGTWARGVAWAGSLFGPEQSATDDSAWKQGAAFADVNNDGRLDLYLCRFDAPNLLYINQGDGTFTEEAGKRGLAIRDASGMAAFCDYDRDGSLDLYLQTNLLSLQHAPEGQRDRLFRNKGDGTFAEVTDAAGISGGTQGHSATWWDFDEDGWPDIYVANDFGPPDRLYRNNRDGTFTDVIDRAAPHTPFSSMGADVGDFDGDGRLDLFVADMAATSHEKDQRTMAGARGDAGELPADSKQAPQFFRNALFLNRGGGLLLEGATLAGLAATDWTWSVRFEDLDNDGRGDLHVTNGMVREAHNTDLLFSMMRAESVPERARLMRGSPVLAERNLAFRNLGNLRFEDVSARWGLAESGVSFGAAFGDLDGDGDLDLVYGNFERGPTVLRNDSPGGHRLLIALRGTRSNRFGIGATVKIESAAGVQVRPLLLARGYLSTSEPIVHFGLGETDLVQRLTVYWPSGHVQSFENLAVDRRYTITEPETPPQATAPASPPEPQFAEVGVAANAARVARETPLEETALQPLVPNRFNRRGPALAAADVDGDGADDLVMGGTPRDPASVLFGDADGKFRDASPLAGLAASPLNDGPVLVFDADGNGTMDVFVTKGGVALPAGAPAYQPVLLLNRGAARFEPAPTGFLPALPVSAGALAAADFDRDGRLDLFLGGRVVPGAYPLSPRSALLANRGGRFEDVTQAIAPGLAEAGMITSALWSDADGDGWMDLIVTTEWGGVQYWKNEQGKRLADRGAEQGFASAGTGWWSAVVAADFNSDGRPDYALGNVGLNTQYHASPMAPAVLFSGTFGIAGQPQPVEAHYENGRLLPWRTRSQLGARFRPLLKKFPQANLFARASLGEILGEENLAAAQRLTATEFQSGVLLSQPDGRHHFLPLPRIAQISPFQGLAAGDFDGDGLADLFAVQNSHAPIPAVGRFDGGLGQLLRGDGRGGFEPVSPGDSGLIVRGDAKALVVLDFNDDSRPDFLVSRNHDSALAFENRTAAGRHLRVHLQGPRGNPTGIGAQVTAVHADGSKQTAEVHSGGGYLSQSTAALFFGAPASNPVRSLRVRWPGGQTTTHAVSGMTPALLVAP